MRLIRVLTKTESRMRIGQSYHERQQGYQLQVDKQLYKYGFKPNSHSNRFISTTLFMVVAFAAGYIYSRHKKVVHDNVIMTIKTNNHVEAVIPEHWVKWQDVLYAVKLNFAYYFMWCSRFFQSKVSIDEQALIRIQQYKNFKKNRNKRMDFMNVGEVVQYPFPNIQEAMQKDQQG